MRKALFLTICMVLLSFAGIHAQYYSTGNDPASIRWKQIRTPAARIIYPAGFGEDARYMASLFDLFARHETKTLTAKVPRMPVIIHNRSVENNGLTVWAPRRIELYPCPPQSITPEEWLEQLVVHEYRHAVQVSKMNQGFSKALYYLFGEQVTGGVLGLYVPNWFLEGDAVLTETALTSSGRGRVPAFENILRAQVVEKGSYSYDKATMGSYKTYIPNEYELGYHLVAWGRSVYGPELWNRALDRSAKLPFMVVPFNSGIQSVTGKTKTGFYKAAMADLRSRWEMQESGLHYTISHTITQRDPKHYTNYNFPVLNDTTSVIIHKSDLEKPDRIVHIDFATRKEQTLITPGDMISDGMSVSGSWLAWSSYEPDPRWNNRSYAVIRLFNMETKKLNSLTRKSRYFFPAISPDEKSLVAVHVDEYNNSSLDIISLPDGEVIKQFPAPGKAMVSEPTWSPDGEEILFLMTTQTGKSLYEIKLEEDSLVQLLPESFEMITGPMYLSDDSIFFTAGYSGIDDIYYLDETTRDVFQVTSSRFGAYNPYLDPTRKHLYWSSYTADGLMLMESRVRPETWKPLSAITNSSIRLYEAAVTQEGCNLQDSVISYRLNRLRSVETPVPSGLPAGLKVYPEKDYSKWASLFNIHSWAPVAFDAGNLTLEPGVMLLSQNVLSSSTASAGYRWNYSDETGTFYANYTYSGLYPVFSLQYEFGSAANYEKNHATGETTRYSWNESTFSLDVSIPWNFSRGRWYRSLSPSVGTSVTSYLHTKNTPSSYPKGYTWYMSYGISAANYQVSVAKDVYPRFGQAVSAVYEDSPFKGIDIGSLLACNLNLYFPGFFPHHGIWLYGGAQHRFTGPGTHDLFDDAISLPRGTTGYEAYDKLFSLSVNYKMPLFYPDWSAGSVLYFKRFSLNLFFDYAQGKEAGVYTTRSTGAELTADLHILRFVFPFVLGVRSIYLPDESSWRFEFLYGINF